VRSHDTQNGRHIKSRTVRIRASVDGWTFSIRAHCHIRRSLPRYESESGGSRIASRRKPRSKTERSGLSVLVESRLLLCEHNGGDLNAASRGMDQERVGMRILALLILGVLIVCAVEGSLVPDEGKNTNCYRTRTRRRYERRLIALVTLDPLSRPQVR